MRVLAGARGLSGVLLVVVVAWALAAVLMLTGTLLASRQIDERVESITNSTSQIDHDLQAVRVAARTNLIATKIRRQADPLAAELREVLDAAVSIDETAGSILLSVRSINANAESINAKVESIEAQARSLDATVESIEAHSRSIEAEAQSINSEVESIDASVASIRRNLRGVLSTSRSIDRGVAGINRRVERVIARARRIKEDTASILFQVGSFPKGGEHERGHRQPDGEKTVHGHANSIDCELNEIDPSPNGSEYCGR